MAKTAVIKLPGGDRTPFLRGILVQSLMQSGLAFDDAYILSQNIRDSLQNTVEITTDDLRTRVGKLLSERYGPEQQASYENRPSDEADILVHTPTRSEPFSVGILAHSLETCTVEPQIALEGARQVYTSLLKTGHREIDHKTLRRLIYQCLKDHCSQASADRYLSWRRFENSGDPLVILIGGATGAGKSTISSEVAYRMDIARIQSTDVMREIIRAYLTPQAVPTLSYSSFEAWRGLPETPAEHRSAGENPVITGFLSQFTTMKPALEATIQRAVVERDDLILEGVHVAPQLLDLQEARSHGLVVPLMLATMERDALRKQLKRRGREATRRKASRYLDGLDDIWELQSYLLSEADNSGIPIITNLHIDTTIREILNIIMAKIMKRYPPHASEPPWNPSSPGDIQPHTGR